MQLRAAVRDGIARFEAALAWRLRLLEHAAASVRASQADLARINPSKPDIAILRAIAAELEAWPPADVKLPMPKQELTTEQQDASLAARPEISTAEPASEPTLEQLGTPLAEPEPLAARLEIPMAEPASEPTVEQLDTPLAEPTSEPTVEQPDTGLAEAAPISSESVARVVTRKDLSPALSAPVSLLKEPPPPVPVEAELHEHVCAALEERLVDCVVNYTNYTTEPLSVIARKRHQTDARADLEHQRDQDAADAQRLLVALTRPTRFSFKKGQQVCAHIADELGWLRTAIGVESEVDQVAEWARSFKAGYRLNQWAREAAPLTAEFRNPARQNTLDDLEELQAHAARWAQAIVKLRPMERARPDSASFALHSLPRRVPGDSRQADHRPPDRQSSGEAARIAIISRSLVPRGLEARTTRAASERADLSAL